MTTTKVTRRQAQYLRTIQAADPGTRYQDIATTLSVTRQAVGLVIRRMSRGGLVTITPLARTSSAKQGTRIDITPLGRLLLAQVQS